MAMAVFFVLFTTALVFGIRFGSDFRMKPDGSPVLNFVLGLGKTVGCQLVAVFLAGLVMMLAGAGNTTAELAAFSMGVTIQSAFLFGPVYAIAFLLAPKFKKTKT